MCVCVCVCVCGWVGAVCNYEIFLTKLIHTYQSRHTSHLHNKCNLLEMVQIYKGAEFIVCASSDAICRYCSSAFGAQRTCTLLMPMSRTILALSSRMNVCKSSVFAFGAAVEL